MTEFIPMLPANWRKALLIGRDGKSARGKRKALGAGFRDRRKSGVHIEPLEQRMLLAVTDVFLQGNYIEIGIHPAGSLGSLGAAPAGYQSVGSPLGLVADIGKNGWGTPQDSGDYFTPGTPEEGWSLKWQGAPNINRLFQNYGRRNSINQVTAVSLLDTSSGSAKSAEWVGTAGGNATMPNERMEVRQRIQFDVNDAFFTFTVTLINTGTDTLHHIEYMRGADPDQEADLLGGSNVTENVVKYQHPDDPEALITAIGTLYHIPLGLGAKNITSPYEVKVSAEGFATNPIRDPSLILGSPELGPITDDGDINLAFRFTGVNLAPGQSISFQYYYTTEINAPPTAEASGPYTVAEGGAIPLSGTLSTDPENGALTYSWDLDGDGNFGETTVAASNGTETGATPTFITAGADGPGARTVTLRVIDPLGASSTDTAVITITNVAPTLLGNITVTSPVQEGTSAATVTANSPFDPSNADTSAPLRYSYDFNNDNTFDVGNGTYGGSVIDSSRPIPSNFLDDGPNTHTVKVRIIDKDGGLTDYTTSLAVQNVPPTATLSNNGPTYRTSSTTSVTFSSQFDPSQADTTAGFKYSYDWNNDGDFNDAGELFESLSPTALIPSQYVTPAGNITVRAQIHDKDGGVNSYTTVVFVNELSTLSGQKFADVNNNGLRDPDEVGLDNFTIVLRDTSDNILGTTFTTSIDLNSNGQIDPLTEAGLYRFDHLIPGTYRITETPLSGWQQTFPNAGSSFRHQVFVPIGTTTISNLDFGNFKLTGEIHGAKFNDLNNNGVRDGSLIAGTQPDVVFIIDVSGSTGSTFRGSPVGDPNGDGWANTILDAEIAGFIALNQRLIDLGFGTTSKVSIVSFDTNADILDMNLGSSGAPLFTNPSTLTSGNPANRDVDEVLRTLQLAGVTNFADALDKARQIITSIGTTKANANVIFLSDGIPNTGGAYNDEVAALRAVADNVRAFGVGAGTTLASLQVIDPKASIFTTTDQLLDVFNGNTSSASSLEPGLNGWTIELIDNATGQVIQTRVTQDVDLDGNGTIDPFSERGLFSFTDLPVGNYTVREVQQSGWVQTRPAAPGTYQVTIAPGEVNTNIEFGNYQLGEINVSVSPGSVDEDGAPNLVYTFTRTNVSPQTPALTINFAVTGNATLNTDYTQSGATTFTAGSGSMTFPTGVNSISLTVDPTADETIEPDEVLTLTISSNPGTYLLGANTVATGAILNDDIAPTANAGGPYTVNEGSAVAIAGSGVDPGDALTFAWDLDGDGAFGETGTPASFGNESGANVVFSAAGLSGDTTRTITLRVSDGPQTTFSTTRVHVLNIPPTANAGGPYTVNEASTVGLSGTGADVVDTVTLEWDLNNNTIFGEPGEIGATPTFNAASINGPSTITVHLRVTDADGASTISTTTVNVLNVPPTANAGGPYTVSEGTTKQLAGSGADVFDTVTFTWDLDGDGTFGETGPAASFGNEAGQNPTFDATTLAAPQTRTVTLRVFDGTDNTTSTSTVRIVNRPAISGQKFNDRNNNGARDEDEEGLDGFTIRLVNSGNATVQTQVTFSDDLNLDGVIDAETESGLYKFTNVMPGSYTIVETPITGWVQTYPTVTSSFRHSVTITSGQADVFDFEFGNFKELGEIHGQKFHDVNYDGGRSGSIITGVNPNVIFVVDVSGSTTSTFRGTTSVGNQNGDPYSNTVLDAEIAGFIALNQKLIDLGYGNDSKVSVVSFSTNAAIKDMDPVAGGTQNFTSPLANTNVDAFRDVDGVLRSLTATGNTNFADALAKAIQIIDTNAWSPTITNVIFLSDGIPTRNDFADEVATLKTKAANVRAFGVGSGASLTSLRVIDGNATIFTTTDQLLTAFGNLTSPTNSTEPGLNGWTIELLNSTGTVIATDITHDVDINGDSVIDPFTERGLYSFGNLPAGNYTVRERLDLMPGWVQTYPNAPGTHPLTLESGDTLRNIDFGNFQLAEINVTVSPASVSEDGAPNLVYTFTRNNTTAATPALTVNFGVSGNATFNNDYTQSGAVTFNGTTGSITFAQGSTTASITIDPTLDEVVEADEAVTLTLTANPSMYLVGGNNTVTGGILNDDIGPIAIAGGNYTVDEGGTVAVSGSGLDPGDTLTLTWDLDGDGSFGETGAAASRGAENSANVVFSAAGISGPSTHTITLLVTDGFQSATSNTVVQVLNVPPSANAGGPYTVNEGATIGLSGTGADVIDTVSLEWDLDNDGTYGETGGAASRGNETGNTPVFNAAGVSGPSTATVRLRVTDFDGASTISSAAVTIVNVAPTANAGGPYTVDEGSTVTLSGTGADVVDGVTLSWSLDGDAAFGETGGAASRGNEQGATPTFNAAGLSGPADITVTLRVTDDDGLSSHSTALIRVVNVAPTAEAGGPYTVNEAGTVGGIIANGSDPVDSPLTYRWDLDGDGTFGETGPAASRGSETVPAATFSAAGLNGPGLFTITLRVNDNDGASSTDTALIHILNVPPTANARGPYTVNEGDTVTLNGTGTDVIDTLVFAWDLDNDGTYGETGGTASRGDETGNAPVFNAANLNGPSTHTITLRTFDGTDSVTSTTTVTVLNVAPTANAGGPYTVHEGATIGLSGTGADVIDTVTLTWDLDNDTIFGETGETGANPVFNAAGISGPNTLTASLLVTDANGATALSTAAIVILNVPPTANAGGPYFVEEGSTTGLSGTGADVVDAVSLVWDLDGDGTFGETGATASRGNETGNNPVFSAASIIAPALRTVTLRVTDTELDSATSTALVTVTAVLPTANAHGPYTVSEGSTVTLAGTGSHPTDTVTFDWDFDGDGVYGETGASASRGNEVGAGATYSAAAVSGASTQTVTLRVSDTHSGQAFSTAVVHVLNVAPTANAGGPYTVNEGATISLSGTGADVVDAITLAWDLNQNGNYGEAGETGPNPTFNAAGVSGPSTTTVSLRVTDADGASAFSTTVVTIVNVAPTANAGGPYTVDEGSTVTLSGTGADVVDGVTLSWSLDGDAAFGETGGAASRGNEQGATPTFNAAGLSGPADITVTLRVTDDNGLSSNSTALIRVVNVAPTAEAGGPYTVNEAGTVGGIIANGSDPVDSPLTYRWDLDGDGTFGETGPAASRGSETVPAATFNAAGLNGPGLFTITLRVNDNDGASSTDTALIHILNVPPTANAGGPYTVDEGGTTGLTGTGSDVVDTVALSWDLDGDGLFGEIGGVADRGIETGNNPVFNAAGLNGPSVVTITLRASDGDDATVSTRTVTVLNVAPTSNAGGPYTVNEGATVGLNGTGADVVDTVSLTWDLDNDSIFGEAGELGANPVFNAATISGASTITASLRVTDANGASTTSTTTIVVVNLPPTANAGGPYLAGEGGTVALNGTGADVVDAVSLQWDLDGDGTFGETGSNASRGNETGSNPVYSAASIIAPAQRTVTLRVTDSDLASATSTALVTITAVAPSVNAGGPYTVSEGSTVTLAGTGSHPTDSVTLQWDFDNDGIFGETGPSASRGNEVGAAATYNAAHVSGHSIQTITLRVLDNHDGQATSTALVHVLNVNPTANAGGPYTVTEGATLGLSGTGADVVDTVSLAWDLDNDGTFGEAGELGTNPVFSAIGVSGLSTSTVKLLVTDSDGASALSTTLVTILNVAPTSNAGGPYTVSEGSTIVLNGTGSDPVDAITLAWDLDGDGVYGETGAGASRGNETGASPIFNATTVSGLSTATVRLRVTDTNGASTTSSTTVTVLNVAPSANAGGPYNVAEGSTVGLTGTGSDPVDAISLVWDLDGDGTYGETGASASRGNETGVNPTFNAAAIIGATNSTVTLRVTDVDGASTTSTALVAVAAVPPTANARGPYTVNEGSSTTLNGTGSHPTDVVSLLWDLDGDGSFGETGSAASRGNEVGPTPTYNAAQVSGNAAVTVTLKVSDTHSGSATSTAVVQVLNVAPSANAGGPYTVAEGASVGLSGSGTDPVDSVSLQWDIDGDSTFGEAGEVGATPVFNAADISGPSVKTVTLRVTDADGASTHSTAIVHVTNVAPTSNAGGPYTVSEGSTIVLNGTGSDPVDAITLAWDLDGDGVYGETGAAGARGSETGATPVFNAAGLSGPSVSTVRLRVTDANGASTTSTTTVTVLNVAPTANAGGPYTVNEGANVALSGTGTDPVDTIALAWDLDGDGTFGETGANASRGNETGATPTFNAATIDGLTTRTVTLRVTDVDGASTLSTATVQVKNVAPTANPGGPYSVAEGSTVGLNGSGGDVIDAVTLTWDLDGDGTFGETGGAAGRGNETGATPVFNAAGLDGPSTASVKLRATDDDGASTTVTVTIQVLNVAPTANAGGPYSVNEGSFVGLSGTGADVIDPVSLVWDLDGDGIYGETGAAAPRGSELGATPTFNAMGLSGPTVRTVTLRVSDDDGGTATSVATVMIVNLPPSAGAGGPYTVNEGSSVQLNGNGDDTSDTVVFSWDLDGDGVFGEIGATAQRGAETGQAPIFDATNADGPQTATITLRVTDSDGSSTTNSTTVTVLNVPPTANAGGPYSVNEGSVVGLTGAGADVIDPISFAWDLDGDGTFGETGSSAARGNETGASPVYNAATLDGPITSTVTLRVTDDDGGSATSTAIVTVHNVAPTASAGAGYSVAEGSSVGLSGTASDPLDAVALSWDLDGDGLFGETGAAAANGNETGAAPIFNAALVDGPLTRTVTLRVTDDDGLSTTSTAVVQVNNVAPAVDANPGAAYFAEVEGTVALTGTFLDPAPADTHTVVWDLDGDGVFGETGAAAVRGNETGLTPVFVANMVSTRNTITLRVTDDDGGVGEDTAIVTIRGGQFDFNKDLTPLDIYTGTPSPTQAGYISVIPRDVFSGTTEWGWTRFTGFWPGFDRGPQPQDRPLPDLLRDGHYGTRDSVLNDPGANTFHVRLPNDIYNINITVGDLLVAHDEIQVNAEGGEPELFGLSNPAGQWIHRSFTVAVTDGILDIEFSDQGGNNMDWVVNGLDIRTVASLNKSIDFAVPGGVIADGVTPVTFTANVTGLADGTFVTLSTSSGTIITPDADPTTYGGQQVQVIGGTITAQVVTSTLGPVTLSALAVNGQAKGEATALPSIAPARRFDFNANQSNGNVTAPGFTSVFTSTVYTATQGYGWQSTVGLGQFQRDYPAATLSAPLRRDGHFSQTNTTFGSTFQVAAKAATNYYVRVYVGDFEMPRSGIQLIIEGVATPITLPTLPAGTFDTRVTAGARDTNNDGRLNIRIRNTAGGTWVANGIEISESPLGAAAQLNAQTFVESFADQPQLTDAQLQPIVAAALDRYTAAGLSAQQAAVLRNLQFQILDLGASTELGNARPGLIQIDDDAAGHGWYIDPTPGDDEEFSIAIAANELQSPAGSLASQGIDLLTLVMHELGHELGLDDLEAASTPHELMTENIGSGTRRLPPSFALSPSASEAAGLLLLPTSPAATGSAGDAAQSPLAAQTAVPNTIQLLAQQVVAQRANAAPINSVPAGHRTLRSPSQTREVDALFADWDQS